MAKGEAFRTAPGRPRFGPEPATSIPAVEILDTTPWDPGYVKGYPPGVRENGGQYTRAATWAAWAFAELGDGDRAWQLSDLLNPVRRHDSAGDT